MLDIAKAMLTRRKSLVLNVQIRNLQFLNWKNRGKLNSTQSNEIIKIRAEINRFESIKTNQ